MANTELAQTMLALIEANREAFRMESWFDGERTWQDEVTINPLIVELEDGTPTCGTTMCLAGWAAVASGYVLKSVVLPDKTLHGAFATKDSLDILCPEPGFGGTTSSYTDFVKLGAQLLDIPLNEADALFEANNAEAEYFLRLLASGVGFDWEEEWTRARAERVRAYEETEDDLWDERV